MNTQHAESGSETPAGAMPYRAVRRLLTQRMRRTADLLSRIAADFLFLFTNAVPGSPGKTFAARYALNALEKDGGCTSVRLRMTDGRTFGRFLLILPEDKAYESLLTSGSLEGGTSSFLETFVRPDDVVLDAGANLGYYTLLFAACASKGAVHAFEPNPGTLHRLRQNLGLNPLLAHVTINPLALSNSTGSVTIFSFGELHHGYASLSSFGRKDASGSEVQSTTIDAYVEEKGLAAIDLIKIDVEGAEGRVIAGARKSIERFAPSVVLEMNLDAAKQYGSSCEDILRDLQSMHEYILIRFPTAYGNPRRMTSSADFCHGDNVMAISPRHRSRLTGRHSTAL